MSDDPYDILGVKRDVSADDLKRHYRQLAKELHPDLNPDKPDVAERFKKVSAAYALLSDPETRGRYDRGEIDASGQERPEQRFYRDFQEEPGATRFYTREGFAGDDELHEFFSDLFGGGAGPKGRTFRMRARGADIAYTLPVDFVEAAKGTKKRVTVDGRTLDITVPPGVRDRQMLRLKGQGGPGFDGGPPGDAFVEIHIQPHPLFERKDENVHIELPVSLPEATLGGRIEVPTVDGPVTMAVPRGSNTGTTLRLRGKGIVDPKSGERGDQYVRLKVMLPKEVDPELARFLEGWAKEHAYDPRSGMGGGRP
ncbi:MAG TPA: J domain-containing protein [Geminicoccaceae bacterium]